MKSGERSELVQVLRCRRDDIAASWYKAIAQTSFVSQSAAEVRQHLLGLTEEFIALLLAKPFEHRRAEAIGASLADLHYIQPTALGRTQEALGRQLIEGLPADQAVCLQLRLAALFGALAVGFSQQAREIILTEQKRIYSALISTILEKV